MTKRQIESEFVKWTPLLHKLSHQCASRCSRPEEDVFGQACYLFMQATVTFDSNRGAFGTYLYRIVHNGLQDWGKRNDLPPNPEFLPEQTTALTPDRQLMLQDWLANLSEECREVATIILNGPAEVLEIGTGGCKKITAGMIKSFLRSKGWTYPRIWTTMSDLKKAVASI